MNQFTIRSILHFIGGILIAIAYHDLSMSSRNPVNVTDIAVSLVLAGAGAMFLGT